MSERHELALRQEGGASALTNLSVRDMIQLGNSLVGTGFLPNSIKTPEQAMAIMLKGQELRVPPMYSLSNIVVVNGKPSCSAELMLALIQRDFGQRAIRVKTSDDTQCTVEYRLEGWEDVQSYQFTIKQAEIAGLFKNSVWKQYPAAMLRARAISAVARMAFPGSIGGMYVPGELGEAVTVNSDGEIVSVSGTTANVYNIDPIQSDPYSGPDHAKAASDLLRASEDSDIPREWIDAYAASKDKANLEAFSVGDLERLTDGIRAKPGPMRAFFAKWGPPSDNAILEAEVVDTTATQGQMPITDLSDEYEAIGALHDERGRSR